MAVSALGLDIRPGFVTLGYISEHERAAGLVGLEILRARLLKQRLRL